MINAINARVHLPLERIVLRSRSLLAEGWNLHAGVVVRPPFLQQRMSPLVVSCQKLGMNARHKPVVH